MSLVVKDRVMETSETTGTGTLTLAGAVTGHQSFSAVGDGNTCNACIYAVDTDGNPAGEWEVFSGTYTASGTTLSRTTVLASSNGGSAVNFAAGTKHVILVVPADQVIERDQFAANTFPAAGSSGGFAFKMISDVGLDLLAAATAALARVVLGLGSAALNNTSDFDAAGLAAAALATAQAYTDSIAATRQPLDADLTAIAALTTDSFGRALLTKTDAASVRTYIGAGTSSFDGAFSSLTGKPTTTSGYGITDAQPLDSDLTAIAALSTTAYGRSFLPLADAAAGRTLLGLGTLATQSGTFSGTSSGTNSGDQNLFSTIAVSGQSNVVADATSDTLTLVAGSNITITTDASTDTITIAASAGGTPGGSNTQVQYNSSGSFAGSSNLTYDGSTFSVGVRADFPAGSIGAPKMTFGRSDKGFCSVVNPGHTFDVTDGTNAWLTMYSSFGGILGLGSGSPLLWGDTPTMTTANMDSGLKRIGAGIVALTDNGTAHDPAFGFTRKSSTTNDRDVGRITASWKDNDSTDATRSGDLILSAYYTTTAREGIRIRGGASNVQIGLNGQTPVSQSTGWSVTGGYTVDKAFNPESTTLTEVARVLGTLVDFFLSRGDIGA